MTDRSIIANEIGNFFTENQIINFDKYDNLESFDEKNPFMMICFKCLGKYDVREAIKIKKLWEGTNNIQYQVFNELFSKKIIIKNGQENIMFIFIQKSLWNKMEQESTTTNSELRKSFLVEFSDHVGALMRQFDINCWPVSRYNYITKKTNDLLAKSYWSGTFSCRDSSCNIAYQMKTKHGPLTTHNAVMVEIKWDGKCSHEIYKRQFKCSRNARKELAKEIALDGLGNVISQNIISNHENDNLINKPTSPTVLTKVKSEFSLKKRIIEDVFIDAEATKLLCERWSVPYVSSMTGLIRQINMNPFGLLLVSEIQIKIWLHVILKYPIWFFDATGSTICKIKNQNKVFHYSLVFHDRDTKCIIPAAEFLTSNQTSTSIAQYLFNIKKLYQQLSGKLDSTFLPKMIVTDHSWALMNAVCEIFNYCSINQYLEWCFKQLVTNESLEKSIPTYLYICSTHFLKIIIQAADKVNAPNNVIFYFKRTCAYLLNKTTMKDFEKCLEKIYFIFCGKSNSVLVLESRLALNKEMGNTLLSETIKISEEEDFEYEVALENSINEFGDWRQSSNITKESPFTSHFDKKKREFDEILKTNLPGDNLDENEYFCPELMNIILKKLYIMPLWSGIFVQTLKNRYPSINESTRSSNNMAESYFSILKNSILNNKDSVMPSQLIGPLFQRIISKYIKFYQFGNISVDPVKTIKEVWKKRAKKENIKKGVYFVNINFMDTDSLEHEKVERLNLTIANKDAKDLETSKKRKSENIGEKSDFERPEEKKLKKIELDDKSDNKMSNALKLFSYNNVAIEELKKISHNTFVKTMGINEELFENVLSTLINLPTTTLNDLNSDLRTKILKRDVFDDYFKKHFSNIWTIGDGNCLYRALSICLIGDDRLHVILRLMLVYCFKLNYRFLNDVITEFEAHDIEFYASEAARNKHWGRDIHVFVFSLLLKRPIYTFASFNSLHTTNGLRYDALGTNKRPIILAMVNSNHWEAVVPNSVDFPDIKPASNIYSSNIIFES